jgi:hypothetical protein
VFHRYRANIVIKSTNKSAKISLEKLFILFIVNIFLVNE